MAIDRNAFSTLYQIYYPDAELPYLIPENLPLLHMLLGGNTDGQVSGSITDMPWLFGPATGVSNTFSVAQQASNNAPQSIRPQVRLSQLYKLIDFQDKDELLSQGEAAYGQLMEETIKGARMEFLNQLDQQCHYNGTGNRGQIASVSGSTWTLTGSGSVETVFEINQQLVLNSTNLSDGTAPVFQEGPFTITNVNANGGALSITVDHAAVVGGVGSYVAFNGDTAGFSSALLNPNIIGLDAFNPFTAVSGSDNFLGVNRSVYPTRLTGYRFDGSQRSVEAAVKRLATLMSQGGVTAGGAKALLNPLDMDQLEDKLASYQRFTQSQLGLFFFDAVALSSPLGRIECVSDPHQQQGFGRLVVPGALQLQYKNGLPHLATLSGGIDQEFGQNFDGRSVRMRAYAQVRCLDPRKLGVVALPAVV